MYHDTKRAIDGLRGKKKLYYMNLSRHTSISEEIKTINNLCNLSEQLWSFVWVLSDTGASY